MHKGIKHADKRNSLSVEILQIEKLEAAEFGRTQSRFNLVLIALRKMCADRLEEISPLRVKSLFFKPFSEIKDLADGDGLGLPLCSLIAGKMNGTLSIDAEYKKGCRFILVLQV